MTEITHEALEALSKAAASGTLTHAGWGDGSTQMGMTNIFNEDHEVCLMECIPEEDAAFICALWNAYRTGQLIHAVPSGDVVEAVARKFSLGDRVTKTKGSSWTGLVVGFYSTSLTPIGYAVESENEPGSVQIYPESALDAVKRKQ